METRGVGTHEGEAAFTALLERLYPQDAADECVYVEVNGNE